MKYSKKKRFFQISDHQPNFILIKDSKFKGGFSLVKTKNNPIHFCSICFDFVRKN